MHSLLFSLLVSVFSASANYAQHHSLPKDIYAFPKYRVSFLKDLSPVENHTALRWLSDGLKGGQQEFLDQWQPPHFKGIESGSVPESTQDSQLPIISDQQEERVSDESSSSPALELLRIGQKSYLCLIPPPPSVLSEPPAEDQTLITPTHSWTLLQPLSGTCLYYRQAWFTYSYCHNVHVRQFRELPAVTHHHATGARVVEEDPEWESYTLGRSPLANDDIDGENAPQDELAIANNLELAHHQAAGQRYLVQRWGDGTPCDKTGRPREVEIQFHCSMTMTDTIMFVKETQTCEYVLVIHTPRLCGEPGFKSQLDQVPEAEIQCREVLNDDGSDSSSSSSPKEQEQEQEKFKHPFRRIPRPPALSPTKHGEQGGSSDKKDSSTNNNNDNKNNKDFDAQLNMIIQKAFEQVVGKVLNLGDGDMEDQLEGINVIEVEADEGDGVKFFSLDLDSIKEQSTEDQDDGLSDDGDLRKKGLDKKTLGRILRSLGYDTQWEDRGDDDDDSTDEDRTRDEL